MKRCIASRGQVTRLACAGLAVLSTFSSCQRGPEPPEFYRFDDNLENASDVRVSAPQVAAGGLLLFDFEGAESSGWTVESNTSSLRVSDGALIVETQGSDSILSPDNLEIDPRAAHAILMRMKVLGADSVVFVSKTKNWDKFRDRAAQKIHIPEPNSWFTYKVESLGLSGRPGAGEQNAGNLVTQVKLKVPSRARIEIDFVRVLSQMEHFSDSPVGVTQHSIDNEIRTCLYTQCPGEVEYRVSVPDNARISTGLGILDARVPVRFSVIARDAGSAKTLFSYRVHENQQWHDARIDMTAYANKEVNLTFKTECADGGNVALWSNPVVYEPQAAVTEPPRSRPKSPRDNINVVFYLIDALRADHLDVYGYSRETAPTIAKLAEEGVKFTHCFSQDTWTQPSMSSLFAGVPALVHGVSGVGDTLPDRLMVLAETLREHGYPTGSLSENVIPGPMTNLSKGFSYVEQKYLLKGAPWRYTFAEATWFLEMHRDRNFFLYIHTMECHDPYAPPKTLRNLFAPPGEEPRDIDLYDATIVRADANLDRFISKLKELDMYDNTLLILTADHGEAFREHEDMIHHSGKPYNELIHVPLIMRLPGLAPPGETVEQNVQLLDVAPTILDVLGLRVPHQFQGKSLIPLVTGAAAGDFDDRPIYSRGKGMTSIIRGDWKLLSERDKTRLYDLATDFGETNDLASRNEPVVSSLLEEMSAYRKLQEAIAAELGTDKKRASAQLDPQTIQRLKDLGYLK